MIKAENEPQCDGFVEQKAAEQRGYRKSQRDEWVSPRQRRERKDLQQSERRIQHEGRDKTGVAGERDDSFAERTVDDSQCSHLKKNLAAGLPAA